MRKSVKLISALFFGLASLVSASAQSSEALPFVRIVRDPARAGMGFAGVASASNPAYSSFSNSAMIPLSEKKGGFGASLQGWAPNGLKSTNIALGGAMKAGNRLGFSFGAASQTGEKFDIYDESGFLKGTDKSTDLVFNAGAGVRLAKNLSLGANVRYAQEKLMANVSYSAICADAFAAYKLKSLNIAAGISSIGSSVAGASGSSYSLPSSVTLAADYDASFADVHGLEVAVDFDYFLSGNFAAAAGLQYSFKDMVFARAGYHLGSSNAVLPSFMTVGLGVRFVGIDINFAYLTANEFLGNTLAVGLGYSF